MLKLNLKTKIAIVFLSIFACFVLFEILLSAAGIVSRIFLLPDYDFSRVSKDDFVVFCAGDSFTYGIGAGIKNSYPAQLEQTLAQSSKGRPVKVFNLGVPGYNSSQTLRKLKENIAKLKPDVAVVLCGANDSWNVDQVTFKQKINVLSGLLLKTKIFKIFNILIENAKGKKANPGKSPAYNNLDQILKNEDDIYKLIRYGNTCRDFKFYEQAESFYQKARKKDNQNTDVLLELGRNYKLAHKYLQALDTLGLAVRQDPDNIKIHAEIKDIFISSERTDKAVVFYEDFLKEFPKNKFAAENLTGIYIKAGGECFFDNEMKKAKAYYEKAILLAPQREKEIKNALRMIEQTLTLRSGYLSSRFKKTPFDITNIFMSNAWINNLLEHKLNQEILYGNLLAIIETCKQEDIKLIFSGYPDGTTPVLKDLCLNHGITLVDHEKVFREALKEKPYEYYFVSKDNSHCTKQGYRLMAENIAKNIIPDLNKK
jgi:tetratricopeptide (TPR) repeat protein